MRFWLFVVVSLFSAFPALTQELPSVNFYHSTAYICGGIGSDEARTFKAVQNSFPLTLRFGQRQGERTASVADVQVVIRDEHDQVILNINSDGPFCLLDIDPGMYAVFSTYEGQTLHQKAHVHQLGHRLLFVWPEHLSQ